MTTRQKQLIENYIRLKVKKMISEKKSLNEENAEVSLNGWTLRQIDEDNYIMKQRGQNHGQQYSHDDLIIYHKLISRILNI